MNLSCATSKLQFAVGKPGAPRILILIGITGAFALCEDHDRRLAVVHERATDLAHGHADFERALIAGQKPKHAANRRGQRG